MKSNTKQCLFCGANLAGNRSIEHVFPQWLQVKYGLSTEGVLQTHFSADGKVLSSRHHNLSKHVCGRVCTTCNNGWMSQLETDTMPLICALAERKVTLNDLNSEQCFLLAFWACKTAYALHAASNYRMIVPKIHMRFLSTQPRELPKGVSVFGHQFNCTEPFVWWQSPTWQVSADEKTLTDDFLTIIRNTAYKISFSINNLALIVAYNPFDDMSLVLWKYFHFPIWPERGPVFWYDRNIFPKDNSNFVCLALVAAMGLQQIK